MLTGLLALLAIGAIVVAVLSLRTSDPTSLVSERTVTVAKGVIESVVSGSGNLEPAKQTDVNFATSGEITKIYVSEGDHVSDAVLVSPAQADRHSGAVT